MRNYQRRVIDDELDEFQPRLAATHIYGAKGVGKTATALQRASSVLSLDQARDRELFRADPDVIESQPPPLLIDEWQRQPEVWDRIRQSVDVGAANGHYLIAGSASVPRGAQVHSGAGRIVSFMMRPLSLAERDLGEPTVSLGAMLEGGAKATGRTKLKLADYVAEITASGFPAIRPQPERVRGRLLDSYISNVVKREFPEQGYPVRKPIALVQWMAAYAAATANTTSYNRILDAAMPGVSDKPSKPAAIAYRQVLARLWLLDPVEAWSPSTARIERLTWAPKHYLADPALTARLLKVDAPALLRGNQGARSHLRDGNLLGALFEHLVALSVKTYAQANDAEVRHLRTHGGQHEVDLVVESQSGGVVALDVKLTATPVADDVKQLLWLRDR
ncbi:MAG: ATP-binding protein, partial [Bifidobacteriaceae bacterium]|nr:ATP-binding protein [Bifidobacteriaceae bacterium]